MHEKQCLAVRAEVLRRRKYTNLLYFDLYFNTAYAVHNIYYRICSMNQSPLTDQSFVFFEIYKKVGVLPIGAIRIVKSNISSVGPSLERNG